MAAEDYDVLQAANGLVDAAYLKERTLDRKTKELIFIVSLTVMKASKGHIQSHIRVALDLAARGRHRGFPARLRRMARGDGRRGDQTHRLGVRGRLRLILGKGSGAGLARS